MDPQNNQNGGQQTHDQSQNQQSHGNMPQGAPMQHAMNDGKVMSILAYIGVLVIVSYLVSKDNPTVKFHIKQGLVLLCIEVITWILGAVLWQLAIVWTLVNISTLILSVVGIVNASQNKQKELPFVGGFAKNFTI